MENSRQEGGEHSVIEASSQFYELNLEDLKSALTTGKSGSVFCPFIPPRIPSHANWFLYNRRLESASPFVKKKRRKRWMVWFKAADSEPNNYDGPWAILIDECFAHLYRRRKKIDRSHNWDQSSRDKINRGERRISLTPSHWKSELAPLTSLRFHLINLVEMAYIDNELWNQV